MGDSAYRGISADQDGRFRNKEQLLIKTLASKGQFPTSFEQRVDMKKVNMEVMRPWITEKVEELLGFEDDIVVEYVNGMLQDPNDTQPDPKKMQLSLTGFLEKNTPTFMSELWTLLLSAQKSIGGIPQEFVEKKKEEMRLARQKDVNAIKESGLVQQRQNHPKNGNGRFHRNGERPKMSRGNDHSTSNRTDFVDKSGRRTERVHDSGWGSRQERDNQQPSSSRTDRYERSRSRSPYRTQRREATSSSRRDEYEVKRHQESSYRQRYVSPERSSKRYSRRRSSDVSISPSPERKTTSKRQRDERSVTPQWRGGHSPSLTPPRRKRDRSPTYSPPNVGSQDDSRSRRRSPRSLRESGRHEKKSDISESKDVLSRSRWAKDD